MAQIRCQCDPYRWHAPTIYERGEVNVQELDDQPSQPVRTLLENNDPIFKIVSRAKKTVTQMLPVLA